MPVLDNATNDSLLFNPSWHSHFQFRHQRSKLCSLLIKSRFLILVRWVEFGDLFIENMIMTVEVWLKASLLLFNNRSLTQVMICLSLSSFFTCNLEVVLSITNLSSYSTDSQLKGLDLFFESVIITVSDRNGTELWSLISKLLVELVNDLSFFSFPVWSLTKEISSLGSNLFLKWELLLNKHIKFRLELKFNPLIIGDSESLQLVDLFVSLQSVRFHFICDAACPC